MPAVAAVQQFVQQIRKIHNRLVAQERLATRDAIELGSLLLDLKAEVKGDGKNFSEYCDDEKNLGFSYRSARRFMALYKASQDKALLATVAKNLSDMPLTEAYRAAGLVRYTAPSTREAGGSRGLGVVVPAFMPAGFPQVERRRCEASHAITLTEANWRQEVLALVSSEKDFQRCVRNGGLALLFSPLIGK